jgi:RNA polymerase sigma-70 factor (ECF subfamily)
MPLRGEHHRGNFRGTVHGFVPSQIAMHPTLESRAMSIQGPPVAFPKWNSRPRSKAQPQTSNTDESALAAPVQSTISKGRAEFEAAVRPALPRLFRFCLVLAGRKDQADDLFQNTLIKAWLNAGSFEGRSELGVWLCGIAWHEHLELQRTEARRKGLFEQFVEACSSALGFGSDWIENTTPETLVADGEIHDQLLRCLRTLPEEFRAVVVLCDIEELGYDRVAEVLGIPKGTVKSRHARGRVRLREAYEKLGLAASAESTREGDGTP